jgi:hypothetical protein
MRTVLRLIPWLVLAGVGAVLAGLWGFLAAAILCGLYYALFRPGATVAKTPEQLAAAREQEERRNSDLAGAVFNRAAKATARKEAAKAKR